jgi:hypothetical protein
MGVDKWTNMGSSLLIKIKYTNLNNDYDSLSACYQNYTFLESRKMKIRITSCVSRIGGMVV